MNCITWNHNWHSTWNCHSFDSASLIAIPLESEEAIHFSQIGHNDSCSLFTTIIDFSVNSDSLKLGLKIVMLNNQYVESCSLKHVASNF